MVGKYSRCVERLESSGAQHKVSDYDLLSSSTPQLQYISYTLQGNNAL